MIRFTNKMFQLFKMQKYEFWRYLNILKQSVIQTGVGVACNAQSRAGGTLMVDFRTVLCQTEECPDVDIFIRYQIYRCRYLPSIHISVAVFFFIICAMEVNNMKCEVCKVWRTTLAVWRPGAGPRQWGWGNIDLALAECQLQTPGQCSLWSCK